MGTVMFLVGSIVVFSFGIYAIDKALDRVISAKE